MAGATRRNFFQHGELALVVLALLQRKPMHGYELLAELDRLLVSYRPSPGSVYPALGGLVAEGLVVAARRGEGDRRQVYRLTDLGEDALARRAAALAAFEVRTGVRLQRAGTVEDAVERLRARVMAVAERVDAEVAERVLEDAAAAIEAATREPKQRRNRYG